MATFPILQTTSAADSNGNPLILTWGSNTKAGNMIFLVFGTLGTISSISDTVGNVYTQISNTVNGSTRLYGYYAKNTNPGTTPAITVNYSGTFNAAAIAREYLSLNTTNPFDLSSTHNDTAANPVTSSATGITNIPSELVIGYSVASSSSESWSAGAGFGNLTTKTDTAGVIVALEDQTVSSIGAQTATFGTSGGNSYVTGVATFKPAGTIRPAVSLRPAIFKPGLAR